jgi:hypothetical protein
MFLHKLYRYAENLPILQLKFINKIGVNSVWRDPGLPRSPRTQWWLQNMTSQMRSNMRTMWPVMGRHGLRHPSTPPMLTSGTVSLMLLFNTMSFNLCNKNLWWIPNSVSSFEAIVLAKRPYF